MAAVIFSLIFLSTTGLAVATGRSPKIIIAAYTTLSLITFIAYARDKSAAREGKWRTSEATLHLLGLAGGWPGALIAQQALRHKSRKTTFRGMLWLTIFLNCAGLIWLHTQAGQPLLKYLAGLL